MPYSGWGLTFKDILKKEDNNTQNQQREAGQAERISKQLERILELLESYSSKVSSETSKENVLKE
jgi:hypothetical protein